VEAEARAIGFSADAGHDLSYLMLGGRPGLLLGAAGRQLLVAYRHEALLLAADDRYAAGPLWFYGAHRGELELELGPALTLFGGVGQRDFRELGRSRLEVDGGIGTGLDAGRRVRLVGALSGRFHDARKSAYDLRGGSLLLLAEVSLLRGWSMRAGALASADHYPRSGGYFDRATDSARRDLLLKLSASGFSPRLAGQLKLGLTYEFARRDSTAAPYDYQDHRVLAKLVWSFTGDPWLPAAVSPADHVALDHGLRAGELQERVQDLLRQDEAAQRSSSCLD
jgi:hypothetical protein